MKNRPFAISICFLLLAYFLPNGSLAFAAEEPAIYYETAVAPVFQKKCSRCHGPQTQEGGLDLTVPAGLLSGGDSGPGLNQKIPLEAVPISKKAPSRTHSKRPHPDP